MSPIDLAGPVLARDLRAIARAIRIVDDRASGYVDLLKALWPHAGRAWVLGVTGNPGAGKSTLCDRLIAAYRGRGERVAVVAIDPTSPYSGGAILGDRIRMARHATDAGVFIRSLATRGYLGGLSRSARDVVRVFDAAGYEIVIVETVGVGQDELDVTRTAHSTLVVVAPGLGDEIQAIKAGLLECADAFAVNKADRDGADAAVRDLELMIALGNESFRALSRRAGHTTHGASEGFVRSRAAPDIGDRWTPPIVKCTAIRNEGIDELVNALDRHRTWLESTGAGRTRQHLRLREELRAELRESLLDAALRSMGPRIDDAVREVEGRTLDPYTATERLVESFRDR
ncbi:MAG TPA: methylmalonyl Co-A mutase-associated GTPase MeaB [Polyangiaceae bacterium]|nr:methylmalonyl Co-A mutase-associated GTPase MeaB [Polyangiaceae bacterium]